MNDKILSLTDILDWSADAIGDDSVRYAIWIAALMGIGLAFDVYLEEVPLEGIFIAAFGLILVNSLALSGITRRHLLKIGLLDESGNHVRLLPLFAVTLLTGLGVSLGFLLLILPGYYLLARWSVAVPIMFAEKCGPGDAMSRSWDMTKDNIFVIGLSFFILYLPSTAIGVMDFYRGLDEIPTMAQLVIANLISSVSTVSGWYVALGIYGALGTKSKRLREIFA